ncbi:MAG: tRNA (adenosine(37)-N6)-threonylcarbamoyltransferase complex ATPase subunit type 1 TsaE [Chloroflexi bacterium]|nr:tRNA (adenosine(37)-N6)-threonylcarbamoyltransferase complex ATPase subunit type 1 TsaE [Chloroflexota bacterium]
MEQSAVRSPATGTRSSASADATQEIGRRIGEVAEPGTVLALVGPLGAGKTQLAKGVARGLGIASVVNSPTFILMNEHVGRLRMYHIDAYRLEDPEDAIAAGLIDERQVDGVTVIEWADRLAGWLPDERLEITIDADPEDADRRILRWRASGDRHTRLADGVLGRS